MPYRYLPQYLSAIDPRAQTEDLGDDPVAATGYAVANLQRVVPNLPAWTARPGEDDADLAELYRETVGMWSRYMRHVASVIGGVRVDPRTAGPAGRRVLARAAGAQQRALAFLAQNAIRTPEWLAPTAITRRTGGTPLASAQAGVLTPLLDARRLDRMAMGRRWTRRRRTRRRSTWGPAPRGVERVRAPDANLRALHRVYLDRLGALVSPPPPARPGRAAGARARRRRCWRR